MADDEEARLTALTIMFVVAVLSLTLLGGCYMVNVWPLKLGKCQRWITSDVGPSGWISVPCDDIDKK